MRTIEWTKQFKRDYKREAKGQHRATLDDDLFSVVDRLANDQQLEPRYRDHLSLVTGKITAIATSSRT